MSELEKDGKLSVKQGKIEVQASFGVDSDNDGVKSIETEHKIKVDLAEALKEVGVTKDQKSLIAIATFVKQYGALLPDIEKDIL